MKRVLPALLTCLLTLLSAAAAAAQPGAAEKRLKDASGAYSFTAPRGFDARQNDEGFALTDAARTALVAVKSHNFPTFEKFLAQANLAEDGVTPVGEPADFGGRGKSFRVSKQTPEGTLVVDTFVLFSPYGGGVLVVAFSEYAKSDAAYNAAWAVAESVRFARPQVSEAGRQWEAYLRGKHLLYLYTSGGYSERRDLHLCPSGRFSSRADTVSSSQLGSGGLNSGSDGSWRVSSSGGVTLVLQYDDGRVVEHKISNRQAGDGIGLSGRRYLVQTSGACPAR